MKRRAITAETYAALNTAFDYFNEKLFGDELRPCVITLSLQPTKKAYGHFWSKAFEDHDEIWLNPATFHRPLRETCATLVHEMAHLWQFQHGSPKKTPHDREWADKMIEVGLIPSSTAEPGGKQTGKKVSHYIEEGGRFDEAFANLDIILDLRGQNPEPKEKKPRKRVKYTCVSCGVNAYGKPDLNLRCGDCDETLYPASEGDA